MKMENKRNILDAHWNGDTCSYSCENGNEYLELGRWGDIILMGSIAVGRSASRFNGTIENAAAAAAAAAAV